MVHSGLDLRPGTLKFRYNKLGNSMYSKVCAELDVEFNKCGQYLCFSNAAWKPILYFSLIRWKWRGLKGTKVLGKRKLREREPAVSRNISAALFFPSTGMVCPYNLTIAYAENAVQNGARVFLDTAVIGIETEDSVIKTVVTNRGKVHPKIVINAAGVFCEDIASMAGDRFYSIHPRKGTNAILDKKYADAIVQTSISSMKTASHKSAHSKGGGIMRTVDGNVLVGPDAIETIEKEDFSTSGRSVAGTFAKQSPTSPALSESQVITYFSGIRACTYEEDFVVCKGKFVRNMIHAAGIQSPGLTAAPAIGVEKTNPWR
jgi:glycerol-3-phosphate dehydrogenase